MLQAIEELRTRTELAHQEHIDSQQRVGHLKKELQRERDLKVAAEGMAAGLATKVGQRQEEVRRLEAEVSQQRDEVCRLPADVNGKSLVSSCCVVSLESVVSLLTWSVRDLGRSQRQAWDRGGEKPWPREGAQRGEGHPPEGER